MKSTKRTQHTIKARMNKLALTIGIASGSLLLISPTAQAAETSFKYGGYIKLDAMFSQSSDAQRAGNVGDDFLVPSTIEVGDGSNEGDVVFDTNSKFSRLWFKTATMTEVGEVNTHIEMDFNESNDERLTNQSSTGLRHAYFSWKNSADSSLLVGQTWSTFFNVGALPESVDFIGPTSGTVFIRQSQVRYTQALANGSLMIAAENPSVSLYDAGSGFSDNQVDDSSLPDLIARYDGSAAGLNYSTAAMIRQINYNDGTNDDSQVGYGITASGKYALSNGDDFKFMISQGQLGRYIALNAFRDGAVEANGDVELISSIGGFVAYRHMWSDKLRSTLSYAFSEADNPNNVAPTVTKKVSNSNVNLMYSPTKNLTFGGEYLMAQREVENGDDGDLNRLQFTSKWVF
ncbi:conserved hypothetical protein [Oleispira antarctica RB-8]|uniref:Porin n=1 Tax=Oleispira antarctica RB-8 TaxID=698738 RepID=R4YSR2_OLEAN|nr:conserved hypothetical protein [Oleispira antarctica RB-8]